MGRYIRRERGIRRRSGNGREEMDLVVQCQRGEGGFLSFFSFSRSRV